MRNLGAAITRYLSRASVPVFSIYAVTAAFVTYFCMYSFRKPFAVARFEDIEIGSMELKTALVISQVIGYALSKAIGIKFNSEMPKSRRAVTLVLLILWAEASLIAFGFLPPAGKVVAMLSNGLSLGAVWGLVFSFLEGRRTSEILGAGLSCSYIVASGAVKSTGDGFLQSGVSESWMPAAVGGSFLPLFALAVLALSLIPDPNTADVAARTEREPMDAAQRKAFVRSTWPGLALLIVVYLFQTSYRDFRDNFAADIWVELGKSGAPEIFTQTEIPIALIVMVILAALFAIRNNRIGLLACYAIMIAGSILIGASTLAYDAGWIGSMTWMIAVGLGLYLGYVPYGCVLFDRTIAALRTVATAVFLIYISDAFAYGGSVVTLLIKEFGNPDASMLSFFRAFSYVTSIVTCSCLLLAAHYFLKRARQVAQEGGDSAR